MDDGWHGMAWHDNVAPAAHDHEDLEALSAWADFIPAGAVTKEHPSSRTTMTSNTLGNKITPTRAALVW